MSVKVKEQLVRSWFSTMWVGAVDCTQVIRLCGGHLYPVSHLTDPQFLYKMFSQNSVPGLQTVSAHL